jgi:hypothetical protein
MPIKNVSRHGRIVAIAGAALRATAVLSECSRFAAPPGTPGKRVGPRVKSGLQLKMVGDCTPVFFANPMTKHKFGGNSSRQK